MFAIGVAELNAMNRSPPPEHGRSQEPYPYRKLSPTRSIFTVDFQLKTVAHLLLSVQKGFRFDSEKVDSLPHHKSSGRRETDPGAFLGSAVPCTLVALGPCLDDWIVRITRAEPPPAREKGLAVFVAERIGPDGAVMKAEL